MYKNEVENERSSKWKMLPRLAIFKIINAVQKRELSDNSDFTQYVDVQQLNEDEKNIWDWVHNQQKDLHIGSVLKCIASHPAARKAVKDFHLKDSFDKLADKLNNYVHSNGHRFYNESYNRLATKHKIKAECKEFGEAAIFITISFLLFW